MSSCREAVEWGFADILRLWSALDFSYNQRISGSPIGLLYRVATILTNIHICLYSCQTSFYFNCCPPSIENYLEESLAAGRVWREFGSVEEEEVDC